MSAMENNEYKVPTFMKKYLFHLSSLIYYLFFSIPIGTLGRPHRQNNFQQNQWLANRF